MPFVATETLIERWNGSKWSIVKSPNPGANFNRLRSVSCPSVSSCATVGDFYSIGAGKSLSQTLIARWNGTTWTRVASADHDEPEP